jgi:tetratricopeptide (TPR) repeat protein
MLLRALAMLVFGTLAVHATSVIEREDAGPRAEMKFMYLPSSAYLDVSSLGFRTVLADAIYLWSIQYYGDFQGRWHKRFDYLWHIYDVITDLDPLFRDPYYLGMLVMLEDAEDVEMAVRILDKGSRQNPDDWFFDYNAGFLRYQQERYEEAAEFFRRAMERSTGANAPVRRLHAAMLARAGRYEDAFRLWREICLTADEVWIRNVAGGHLFNIQVSLDSTLVKRASAEYRARHGRLPQNLYVLVREGLIPAAPADPYGEPYAYDPETGEIACRSQYNFKRPPLSCLSPS